MTSLVNLVIPAAGSATRLRPLSSNTSKVMVRVNGKPCLDYIIEQARKSAEINEIVVVDGEFNDIREYCRIKHPNVKLVKQGSLNGPRDAIRVGMEELDNPSLPVVVWLGDAIILQDDMPFGTDFLLTKQVKDHSAWCMWDGKCFYNKPSITISNASALVGLYSFEDGLKAKEAFCSSDEYDISYALEIYDMSYSNINTEKWYDIGELHSYYKTCAELLNLKSRAFNNIEYDSELGTVRKSPDYHNPHSVDTIENEKSWYDGLTQEQSLFTPRVLDTNFDIVMSYESGTLLSDLMLYENLSYSAWEYIMDKVITVKKKFFNSRCDDSLFMVEFDELSHKMWVGKTTERLKKLELFDSNPSLYVSLIETANKCYQSCKPISGMHGDLHFGNILYNQQTDQLKLIDPRGSYGSFRGVYGDDLYDWAKLAHDLYHGYGAMVANVKHNQEVKEIFINKLKENDLPVDLILAGGLLLIATCIPLHYDDAERQQRFMDYVSENYEKYSV